MPPSVVIGIGCCVLGLALSTFVVVNPGQVRLPAHRRRPDPGDSGGLARYTSTLAGGVERAMVGRDLAAYTAVLDRAGVRTPLPTVVVLVGGAMTLAGLLGLVLGGALLGVVLAAVVPVAARVLLNARAARRRTAFGDQLEDSLQLMASSLRAGHSLPQAIAAVARDAEAPTSDEFNRIMNETRVGRDLGVALEETAIRMRSADLRWVNQAIGINREVGGNLAEVLDQVTVTIRERNQLRRQVSALSAEGRLSANVLIAMPFAITGFLAVANPTYIARFTESAMGYVLIVVSVVLLIVGWLWMRRLTRFDF